MKASVPIVRGIESLFGTPPGWHGRRGTLEKMVDALTAGEEVRAFVRAAGGTLTATSANRAGEQPARTAAEVAQAFPAGLALIVDGGAARTEQPSTVVDVNGAEPRLIREGVIPWSEIKAVSMSLTG